MQLPPKNRDVIIESDNKTLPGNFKKKINYEFHKALAFKSVFYDYSF